MSTPWIQMRTNLPADPHVRRLARALKITNAHAVGLLYLLWSIADTQTADGVLVGWDEELLDEELATPGFTKALLAGLDGRGEDPWLIQDDDGRLRIPDFDAHMSSSAKRRAQNNRRVARHRAASPPPPPPPPETDPETDPDPEQSPQETPPESSPEAPQRAEPVRPRRAAALPGQPATESDVTRVKRPTITDARTRGEERREEEIPPPCASHMVPPEGETLSDPLPAIRRDGGYSADFERWWGVYPRKNAKRAAARAWQAAVARVATRLAGVQRAPPQARRQAADDLLAAATEYARSPLVRDTDMTLIPHAATWLNGDRYDDDRASWNATAARRSGKPRIAGADAVHAESSAHNPRRIA